MHQACCARAAGPASLDGNRYRLSHAYDDPERPSVVRGCADRIEPEGRCQAEYVGPTGEGQCPQPGAYRLDIYEGSLLLCAHDFRRHSGGEDVWVYLPPL